MALTGDDFQMRKKLLIIVILVIILCGQSLHANGILRSMEKEFIRMVNKVSPSIVEISASKRSRIASIKQENVGTGIIISGEGHIVTTESVVEGANKVQVTLMDGRSFDGKVVGADPASDIAVISINTANLPVIAMGNSDTIRYASWILTLGRSYGESPTISFGIVNGFEVMPHKPAYYKAIKITANASPGNSGGAAIDMDGNLVGIVTAGISEPRIVDFGSEIKNLRPDELMKEAEKFRSRIEGGYQTEIGNTAGMLRGTFFGGREGSFAIPINYARKIVGDLIEYGEIERGWLGVHIDNIDYNRMRRLGLDSRQGVVVMQVSDNSPALKAGIKENDVIIAFNGKKVGNTLDLSRLVSDSKPRTKVNLTIIRNRQRQSINVEISRMPKYQN